MRAGDLPGRRRRLWVYWQRFGATVITTIALGIAAYAVKIAGDADTNAKEAARAAHAATVLAVAQVRALKAESHERRNQQCRVDEGKQADDIEQLRQTYGFLVREQREGHSLKSGLNRAVLASLPRVEQEARTDDAPPFCNEPGVGEPEPGPRLPRRPPSLPKLAG